MVEGRTFRVLTFESGRAQRETTGVFKRSYSDVTHR